MYLSFRLLVRLSFFFFPKQGVEIHLAKQILSKIRVRIRELMYKDPLLSRKSAAIGEP